MRDSIVVLVEKNQLTEKIEAVGLGDRLGWGRIQRDEQYQDLLEQLEARYNGQEVK